MTIDEPIEALTHTVGRLAQMHQDNERRYEERFKLHEEHLARLDSLSERVVRILEYHDQRLRRLEDWG